MLENDSAGVPLKIFLCDLAHSGSYSMFPLGIGLIASYALRKFGARIEVRLFKYPEKLYEALQQEKCDIIGSSIYIWNHNLSLWACRLAKRLNPSVITCLGGPDFPILKSQQIEYFKEKEYIDFKVLYEGEVAFSNIIERVLERPTASKLYEKEIDGCTFYNKQEGSLIQSRPITLKNLDEIPSPYSTGLLDQFFDGKLVPIIHTTRGCPFSCNFCVESDSYYNSIRRMGRDEAVKELHYIGEKISKTSIQMLSIADSNYGMYKYDKIISETIVELQKKYKWPLGIHTSTGKKFDSVMENTEMLRGSFDFTMSVQSMDKQVLEEIGRKNISPEKYKEAAEILRAARQPTLAETIVPLPKETLDSYLEGVKELIEWGVKRIITNTLMVINGTEYKDPAFLLKYDYETRYRVLGSTFGEYGGEKVFEYEEVGISTDTLTFEDYIEVRKVSFLVEILFNSSIFIEIELFLTDNNLHFYDFIMLVYREITEESSDSIRSVFVSFGRESQEELKDSPSELVNYYSNSSNYEKLLTGEIGGNVKFKHKVMLLSDLKEEWIDFVFTCLIKFVEDAQGHYVKSEIDNLRSYITCRLAGVLDENETSTTIEKNFAYDLNAWINQIEREKKLSEYKIESGVDYKFYFEDQQRAERNHLFSQHDSKNLDGLVNILGAIRPQQRLYRKVEQLH